MTLIKRSSYTGVTPINSNNKAVKKPNQRLFHQFISDAIKQLKLGHVVPVLTEEQLKELKNYFGESLKIIPSVKGDYFMCSLIDKEVI